MEMQDRFIAPGLGVVIVLAAFILGVPLVYKLLLSLLGLAAAGTYFAPYRVQVETRIVIALVGLVILLIVSSTAFWLTLLSFAAIAALQFQHRHVLQRNPATIAWLRTLLEAAQARRAGVAGGTGVAAQEAGVEAEAGDGVEAAVGEARPAAPAGAALPGFVRMNVAGVGSSILGGAVLLGLFMPWIGFLVSVYGETVGGPNFTLLAAAEDEQLGSTLRTFFFALLALGLVSAASIALPRLVAAIIAAVGFVVTIASYLFIATEVDNAVALSGGGVDAVALPAVGALLAAGCFLVMVILQLIPAANRSR